MKITYRVLAVPAVALMLLAGCDREGPAERAGENIDEAMEETGERIESATDRAGDTIEDAGDDLRDRTDN